MKKIVFIIYALINVNVLWAQEPDTLDLFSCLRLARNNAPFSGNHHILDQEWDLTQKVLSTTNLPSINAFGKAWYQSDAISVTLPIPGMEGITIDQFQYNLGLQVDQKIYDGGLTKHTKELEEAKYQLKKSTTETSLYQLNDVITQLYYSQILIQKTIEVFELLIACMFRLRCSFVSISISFSWVLRVDSLVKSCQLFNSIILIPYLFLYDID